MAYMLCTIPMLIGNGREMCSINGGVGAAVSCWARFILAVRRGHMLRRCHIEGKQHPHPASTRTQGLEL